MLTRERFFASKIARIFFKTCKHCGFTSFDIDGFTLGKGSSTANADAPYQRNNANSATYVAWCWKAGGATTVANTDGSIASAVSVNKEAGFSIVTYTGTNGNGTFGHGLGSTPEVILRKNLSASENWTFYTTVIDGSLDYMRLNNTDAAGDSGYTAPTSTVFTNPGNTNNFIYYSFVSVAGFSKISLAGPC